MGRDVKRYFEDLHRFLNVRRLLSSPRRRLSGGRGLPGWRGGVRQPEPGTWRWSWRGQGFVEPNRALAKLLFPGSGGRTARVNGIVAVARVAHRSGIEMTIPSAWIRVSLKLTPSGRWRCLDLGLKALPC